MARKRNHNEYFRIVSLGGRKSCPTCKSKLADGQRIWSWGNYIYGRWHTVKHFCRECFEEQVREPLIDHADDCGCSITIICRDYQPSWLTLEPSEVCHGVCS